MGWAGLVKSLLLHRMGEALSDRSERASDLGGAEGIRTPGLLVANEARYQLRHSPSVVRRCPTTQNFNTAPHAL
jgi:hypothetical protein